MVSAAGTHTAVTLSFLDLSRYVFFQVFQVFLRRVRGLLVTASVVPSSPFLVTLMKRALSSSETSVLTRATRRNITENTILHSHRRENLKSYTDTIMFVSPSSHFLLHRVKNVHKMCTVRRV
jgi:hypothetical protein